MMNLLKTICVLSLLSFAVSAQTTHVSLDNVRLSPRLLNYQGYLTDTTGIPITNPSVSMIFAIYDALSSGNQKWTETQSSIDVNKGVFSVLLGSVTPIPDSVFSAGTDRWLELTVGGQILTPRTRITSVGYAYTSTYSDTAAYAKAGAADNDWTISGNVLYPSGLYGLSMRGGNMTYGTYDSTHVNFGTACTTGISGQNNEFCTIGGGEGNAARAEYSTIGGGFSNEVSGVRSTIGGGYDNTVSNSYATVGGGYENTASNIIATVSGGQLNTASGYGSVVGGGYENKAISNYTVVSGGVQNYADNYYSAIGGGYADTVIGRFGGILSGYSNLAGDALDDTAAIVAGGWDNQATAKYATVGGGSYNTATGDNASIGGGEHNDAGGLHATVAGGRYNNASGYRTAIGGGEYNSAGWGGAVVAGGSYNRADSAYTFIGGGYENFVAGNYSAILGGYADTIATGTSYSMLLGIASKLTQDSTVMIDMPHIRFGDEVTGYEFPEQRGVNGQVLITDGTGNLSWSDSPSSGNWSVTDSVLYTNNYWGIARGSVNNILYGDSVRTHINFGVACTTGTNGQNIYNCTIGGGRWNVARGNYATISGGRYNAASGNYSTVAGGSSDTSSGVCAAISGGFRNIASGDYSSIGGGSYNESSNFYTTVSGGTLNEATEQRATVGGGNFNIAGGSYSTISGGSNNRGPGNYTAIGGGYNNHADSIYATVAGGRYNNAVNIYATVCGGDTNIASGAYATIGGGWKNTASGTYAVVPGGYNNTASGNMSFAAGNGANAQHRGCFVWADSSSASTFSSTGNNQFRVRATGGIDFTGNVAIRNAAGDTVVELGAGLDYAEGFDVRDKDKISAGSVLSIDTDHPGKLSLCTTPYDTKVAGIAAGANGLGSGIQLGGGQFDCNVALAGRVYCNVDASGADIEPGDLLTTSAIPGYAMKVIDHDLAQGAILGKAMQKLEKGASGQILVLVTLQ